MSDEQREDKIEISNQKAIADEKLYRRRKLDIMIGSNAHAVSMGIDYENSDASIVISWDCPKCGLRKEHRLDIFDCDCPKLTIYNGA